MKIFFDTEFTGLVQNTKLISIGMIDENERAFYAEMDNLDIASIDPWIVNNVLEHTILYGTSTLGEILHRDDTFVTCGSYEELAKCINKWFEIYDTVELVSDVSHYDMVLFCELFGGALNLPKKIVPDCYNICQEIAKFYNCTMAEAFDKSREDFILDFYSLPDGLKHNALGDAKVIKLIYKILQWYQNNAQKPDLFV